LPDSQKLTMQQGVVAIRPDTVDVAARTVEIVMTTGEGGKRWHWDMGEYIEELEVSESAIRTARLDKGLSVIDTHRQYEGVDGVFGITEGWSIEGGLLIGIARFGKDERSDTIFQKVQDGILRHFSLGYRVHEYTLDKKETNKLDVYRATDWEPLELSIVPVSFETMNGARSAPKESELFNCKIKREVEAMPEENAVKPTPDANRSPEPQATEVNTPNESEIRANVLKDITEARSLYENLGLDAKDAEDLVMQGRSIEDVRSTALEAMQVKQKNSQIQTVRGTSQDADEMIRQGIEGALLHKSNPGAFALDDNARRFMGFGLTEMARQFVSTGDTSLLRATPDTVIKRAMNTTSDFPILLENIMHKSLLNQYEAEDRTFVPLGRKVYNKDFRPVSRVRMGDAPVLEKRNENGELKQAQFKEGREQYALEEFGKKVAIGRRTFINDDLDFLRRIPQMWANSGVLLQQSMVWDMFINNVAMADEKSVFHTDHGNLLSGATSALSKDSLSAARKMLRKQKTMTNQPLNVVAEYLVVPAALETKAEELLIQTIVAAKTDDTNPFKGKLKIIVEPRLDDNSETAWYLFADYNRIDTFEYAFLEGNGGMDIATQLDFEGNGVTIRAIMDFACGIIDHRGMLKSTGVA